MEVRFKKSFVKELTRCPQNIQIKVKAMIEVIENSKRMEDTEIDFIYLKGQRSNENYIRIRLGNYRIGAELIDPDILIITIGSRGDVYKHFPPQ